MRITSTRKTTTASVRYTTSGTPASQPQNLARIPGHVQQKRKDVGIAPLAQNSTCTDPTTCRQLIRHSGKDDLAGGARRVSGQPEEKVNQGSSNYPVVNGSTSSASYTGANSPASTLTAKTGRSPLCVRLITVKFDRKTADNCTHLPLWPALSSLCQ